MFVEYMNGGCLYSFISKNKKLMTEKIMAYIIREVLLGLSEVHKRHQIHRDIKSDNILVNT